jgi:hypothetical protein
MIGVQFAIRRNAFRREITIAGPVSLPGFDWVSRIFPGSAGTLAWHRAFWRTHHGIEREQSDGHT